MHFIGKWVHSFELGLNLVELKIIKISTFKAGCGAKIANVTNREFPNDAVSRMRFSREIPMIPLLGGVASTYKC